MGAEESEADDFPIASSLVDSSVRLRREERELERALEMLESCDPDHRMQLPHPFSPNNTIVYSSKGKGESGNVGKLLEDWYFHVLEHLMSKARCGVQRLLADGLQWNALGLDFTEVLHKRHLNSKGTSDYEMYKDLDVTFTIFLYRICPKT